MDQYDFSKIGTEEIDKLVQSSMSGSVPMLANTAMDFMFNQTKRMVGTLVGYKELMMMYTCAIKEVQTKFDVLNTEFNVRYQRNPISSISTRLKRTASITEKLARQGICFSLENIEKHINDVAGVRVICSYIDDIYKIADSLLSQDDITLITRKDYISSEKERRRQPCLSAISHLKM